jgi:lipid-binding SYLF domain-containing protein
MDGAIDRATPRVASEVMKVMDEPALNREHGGWRKSRRTKHRRGVHSPILVARLADQFLAAYRANERDFAQEDTPEMTVRPLEPALHPRFTARSLLVVVALSTLLLAIPACRTPEGDTAAQQRAHIKQANGEILNAVYEAQPQARNQVARAAGYATLSMIETKAMILGSGNGYGLATDKKSGKQMYLTARKLHVGFGAGIQNLQVLMIFKKRVTFDEFIAGGWTFGGGADAGLKASEESESVVDAGLQVSAEGDPLVYQITEVGVALGATVEGLKISQDEELN